MKEFKRHVYISVSVKRKVEWSNMLEPHSDEELEYIRYLLKKYIPGLKSQGKELPTIMFGKDSFDDEDSKGNQ
jgi:hypothetical protein